jgi:hypothetical protein
MNCDACQRQLLDYEGDALTSADRAEIAAHLLSCPTDCREQLELIRTARVHLLNWPDQEPNPDLAQRTIDHVNRAERLSRAITGEIPVVKLGQEDESHGPLFRKPLKLFRPWLSGAAAAALVATVGYYVHLDQMQLRLATEIFGSDQLQPETMSVLRLSLFDPQNHEKPVANKPVKVRLRANGQLDQLLYEGVSDQEGQIAAPITLPALADGDYQLVVEAADGSDVDTVTHKITVKRAYKVMLSSDKPMYQPGQTIHARALVFDSGTHKPAERDVIFSVQDPKGSRIYKKLVKSDRFGIAAFDLPLADELNLGNYKIKAEVGDVSSDLDLQVSRYSLPKFDVKIDFDQTYVRPGQTITGHVRARYFFGKPADESHITLSAGVLVDGFRELEHVDGYADKDGVYRFEMVLPPSIPGTSLADGSSILQFTASVKDKAGQTVEKHADLMASQTDLVLSAVPEAGALIPGIENRILVLVARPTGDPVKDVQVTLQGTGQSAKTNEDGVAVLTYVPSPGRRDISLQAFAPDGTRTARAMEVDNKAAFALVRTDKSLYQAGDTIAGEVLSTSASKLAFVDVVQDGHSIFTQTVNLDGGKGTFSIDLSPERVGTLSIEVYSRKKGDTTRVRKTVYVSDPRGLKVEVGAAKDSFRPGEKAKLTFKVTDESGKPTAAGLGVSVVDESVFALANQDPAMLKAYLSLAETLRKPQFNLDPTQVITSGRRQDAASMLFAASQPSDSVHWLGGTTPQNLRLRENALLDYKSKRTNVVWVVGLFLFGLLFEGVLRLAAEKLLVVLFRRPIGWLFLGTGAIFLFLDLVVDDRTSAVLLSGIILAIGLAYFAVQATYSRFKLGAVMLWGGVILMTAFGVVTIFGDNIRKMFGASVNALANTSVETTHGAYSTSQHRNVVDFASQSTMDGPSGGSLFSGKAETAPRPRDDDRKETQFDGVVDDQSKKADNTSKPRGPAPLSAQEKAKVRVRSYFPETLFWAPNVVTDASGQATLELPGADSITSWRAAVTANSLDGRIGTGVGALKVFQDFFVDVELPPVLTVGDEVEAPLAVYNYLDKPQKLKIEVEAAPWLEPLSERVHELTVQPGQVTGIKFRFRAKTFGKAMPITVYAVGDKLQDAVRREVEVRPNGVPFDVVSNGTATANERTHIVVPKDAIDGATHAEIRFYPSTFSAVMDGLESVLRMPSGCFEQTSSATYPNALVMKYLKDNQKGSPELLARGEEYLTTGYQRLLSFEVQGGGFEWFGRAPANQVLTSYGLLEFHDMQAVFPVENELIQRSQNFLVSKQQEDGSWHIDQQALWDGLYRDQFRGEIATTAYVAWALAESGYRGTATDLAAAYLRRNVDEPHDNYTRALVANALLDLSPGNVDDAVRLLANNVTQPDKKTAYWSSGNSTLVYSQGNSADVETTALAALAMLKAHRVDLALGSLNWLLAQRDPHGSWASTQATVLALKALLTAADMPGVGETSGKLVVLGPDKVKQEVTFTPQTSDVVQRLDLAPWLHGLKPGEPLEIAFEGDASTSFQLELAGYRPRTAEDKPALALDLGYDRATLSVDDTLMTKVTATYQRPGASGMVLITAAIPPGFDLVTDDLLELVANNQIAKFTNNGKELLLYVDRLKQNTPVTFSYRVRAKYPVKVTAPSSSAYLYYQPEVRAESKSTALVVAGK